MICLYFILKKKRREQAQFWMYESINESLKNNFYENPVIEEELKKYEESVLSGKLDSFMAAQELLQMYKELGK